MSENKIFDPEVWGHCLHKEIKEFQTFKPTGLIRPKPVLPKASLWLSGNDAGLAKDDTDKQTYSLFSTPNSHCTVNPGDCETLSSARQQLDRLYKQIAIKDRLIKFHLIQRNQASVVEEELQTKLAASLNELNKMNIILQNVSQQIKYIQNENKELRMCVKQLELQNSTLQEQSECHLKETGLIKGEGQGIQDGGGEGLSEKSNMSSTFRTDSLSFFEDGKGPFVSPVKFDRHSTCLWDDASSKGDNSSNASTTLLIANGVRKSSRSFLVRLRTMIRKFGSRRYHRLQE